MEACEFRQNFLYLRPAHAVILNIEPDHFDCYRTQEALESAFATFAGLLPADGRLIVPSGDAVVARVVASAGCRIETFGMLPNPCVPPACLPADPDPEYWVPPGCPGVKACQPDVVPGVKACHPARSPLPAPCSPPPTPDWVASKVEGRQGQYGFDLIHDDQNLGRIELSVPGRHNVLNALAAAALAAGCGVPAEKIVSGLSRFRGLRRRLEPLGMAGGVTFWDDYAHHPTEIRTTLQTMREVAAATSTWCPARIWCLFQPHQALRTARLLDELASSLQNAERVLIADIFRAREGPPRLARLRPPIWPHAPGPWGKMCRACTPPGISNSFSRRT